MTMTRRLLLVLSALFAAVVSATATIGDAAALQARIDACGIAGCAITIEPGEYTFDRTVTVPTRVDLRGAGPSTVVHVGGDFCGFAFTGALSAIRSLSIDAVTAQDFGCGIDYTSAQTNIAVSDLTFGHYLETGLKITPAVDNVGIYTVRNVRWNGVLGSGTAIRIGDGLHHISDVLVDGLSGTASAPSDMAVWVDVAPNTDTIDLARLTLIKGGAGVRVGVGASGAAAVTGFTLHDSPAIESMTAYGVLVQSANNVRIKNISVAQSQGGIGIGAGVRGLLLTGSTLHYNKGDGVTMWAGASGATISDNLIADNNIAASYWGFGVSIGSGVSDFTVSNNRIGNGLVWGGGQQRYCVFLASGPSNRYSITGNACVGHTAGTIVDGGTGTKKVVTGNF